MSYDNKRFAQFSPITDTTDQETSFSASMVGSNDKSAAACQSDGDECGPTSGPRAIHEPNPDCIEVELARIELRNSVHSVFPKAQKSFIVFMAALGGFFSALSANIYFPALNVLAKDLSVSPATINLTLTTYMIFQGLAPTLVGDFADNAGRRPAYIACFIVYIGANIGLALQRNYAALLVLRCLQSTGSSSTIALATGVVADIATTAERGTYMGFALAGTLLGPAIGPVIGGLLSAFLGWPAIFWFLTIFAAVYLVVLVLAFPETGRKIVGDGSVPPPRLNWSLPNYLASRNISRSSAHATSVANAPVRTQAQDELERKRSELAAKRKLTFPNPLKTLKIIAEKDVALLLFYNALVYTAFMVVASSAPSIFAELYNFNELQIGLSFIPYGVACCIASWLFGALVDLNFRRTCRNRGVKFEAKSAMDLRAFPLEKTRLQIALPSAYAGAAVILCYGWAIQVNAPLAPVLVLQFLIGLLVSGSFNVMSTLMVDLYPQSPATATACNNLVRCLIGAGGTAAIVPMINAMGKGWAFTFVALVVGCFSPMAWMLYFRGMRWREQRRVKIDTQSRNKSLEKSAT